MMITRKLAAAVTMIGIAGWAGLAAGQPASTGPDWKSWDTDHDGTIDLTEAKKAAQAQFDALDANHDGKIDQNESVSIGGSASFVKADTDKDGTVDKNEYMKLVEAKFNAADSDHDGTLSESELSSPAGRSLARLLK